MCDGALSDRYNLLDPLINQFDIAFSTARCMNATVMSALLYCNLF